MRVKTLIRFCTAVTMIGTHAHAETLNDAVSKALATHPTLESASAVLDNTRHQRKEFVSNYYPTLSANVTGGRIFQDNATTRGLTVTRGSAYSYLWEGGMTARQMLFDGFETRNRIDSANARKLAAEFTLTDTRETLAFNTIQSYVEVLRTRKSVILIENQLSKTADYLSRIEQAMNDGAADESEYKRASDILSNLEGLLIQYKGQEMAAIAQYTEYTGHAPPKDLDNPDERYMGDSKALKEALDYVAIDHPAVRASIMSLKSAGYDIAAEKAQYYPDINGELSYLKSDKREEIGGELEDGRAVLRVTWDFETGSGQSARVAQKKSREAELRARVEQIKRQVQKGVMLAYAELKTSQELLDNQAERTSLTGDLYNTYQEQYEGALVRMIDLAQADFEHFQTVLDLTNAAHRALVAEYAVRASTGELMTALHAPPTAMDTTE